MKDWLGLALLFFIFVVGMYGCHRENEKTNRVFIKNGYIQNKYRMWVKEPAPVFPKEGSHE